MAPEFRLAGHRPGAAAEVARLHAVYYHRNWGLDQSFEAEVMHQLGEFLGRLAPDRDLFLAAYATPPAGGDERLAGAVAVDGRAEPGRARLRWFIVDPCWHGAGLGKRLLHGAVDFAREAGHGCLYLWTFEGLTQARKLYEGAGFRLVEEHRAPRWGQEVNEQKFELDLATP
ncbi:MAG: GNAT family N-acetyltransferase [Deltaproteobacteria bacterium]|nr:GNAT family N-acetyltransferase [Deltaproteobacteria bacterium]